MSGLVGDCVDLQRGQRFVDKAGDDDGKGLKAEFTMISMHIFHARTNHATLLVVSLPVALGRLIT